MKQPMLSDRWTSTPLQGSSDRFNELLICLPSPHDIQTVSCDNKSGLTDRKSFDSCEGVSSCFSQRSTSFVTSTIMSSYQHLCLIYFFVSFQSTLAIKVHQYCTQTHTHTEPSSGQPSGIGAVCADGSCVQTGPLICKQSRSLMKRPSFFIARVDQILSRKQAWTPTAEDVEEEKENIEKMTIDETEKKGL